MSCHNFVLCNVNRRVRIIIKKRDGTDGKKALRVNFKATTGRDQGKLQTSVRANPGNNCWG